MGARVYADRFLIRPSSGTIDLASGSFVTLRRFEASVPGLSDAEWLERCARLAVVRHPGHSALIDYGLAGPLDRFEAHLDTLERRGRRSAGGIVLQPRGALDRLVEILDSGSEGGFRVIQLQGETRSGLTTTLMLLAREARMRGYIPVSTAVLEALIGDPLTRQPLLLEMSSRSLLILHDETSMDRHESASVLARSVLAPNVLRTRFASGGVVIIGTRTEVPDLPRVTLDPIPAEGLMKMLGPAGKTFPTRVVRRAIDRAAGRPGVFLKELGLPTETMMPASTDAGGTLVARETSEGYGTGPVSFPRHDTVSYDRGPYGPVLPQDEGSAWRKIERHLRDSRVAFQRRGMHRPAAIAGLRLGMLLLRRGRIEDAGRVSEETMQAATAAGLMSVATLAAACLGLAQTDAGHLRDAEALLRAARSVSVRSALCDERLLLDLVLARCLYWQGRTDEAWILIEPLSQGEGLCARQILPTSSCVHEGSGTLTTLLVPAAGVFEATPAIDLPILAGSITVRVALAASGPQRAMQLAGQVLARARTLNRPLELALGHYALGVVHAAVGDRDALASDIAATVTQARRAGAPLIALRARVLGFDRLRYQAEGLPGLLGARVRLAQARDATPARAGQLRGLIDRWTRESGAKRLRSDTTDPNPGAAVADLVARVLALLHDIDDQSAALTQIAAQVAREARAAEVAIFGRRVRGLDPLASFGRVSSRTIAERASVSGIVVRVGGGGEDTAVAAPIQHARAVVGVITCRWTADAEVSLDRVEPLLVAAAAALGPAVRLLIEEPVAHVPDGGIPELLGSSSMMMRLRDAIVRAAAAPFPVLIEGESGSGKELVARAIHARSDRRTRKFRAVNCAALTDDLLEAELFGHAKGAFTGAATERQGLFEDADGGVLLLDEVSELSPRAQAKLLRAIQEREVRRIGENFPRPVDVRILGATNRPLRAEAAGGRFRQDLLYRLDVIRIAVPPLRERAEDIPLLASTFWSRSAERVKSRATLSPATLAALANHAWPGNVRELQNVIAALAVKAPPYGRVGATLVNGLLTPESSPPPVERLSDARRRTEERLVRSALVRCGGNCGRAAAELGVTRQGLAKLMTRLGMARVSSDQNPHGALSRTAVAADDSGARRGRDAGLLSHSPRPG